MNTYPISLNAKKYLARVAKFERLFNEEIRSRNERRQVHLYGALAGQFGFSERFIAEQLKNIGGGSNGITITRADIQE